MEHEAALDIAEDTMRDDALTNHDKRYHGLGATDGRCDCPECVMGRLIDRQSAMIKAQDESRAIKDQRIAALEAQVAHLKDSLEEERGRNRVLGFQIRTLREGK